MLGRLAWRLEKRGDIRRLAVHRANNIWAAGEKVTWRTRRRLRREARRDLAL